MRDKREPQVRSSACVGDGEAARANRRVVGRELLQHATERDARLLKEALEASREGDDENCHLAMVARAANQRFIDKLRRDLAALDSEPRPSPTDDKLTSGTGESAA